MNDANVSEKLEYSIRDRIKLEIHLYPFRSSFLPNFNRFSLFSWSFVLFRSQLFGKKKIVEYRNLGGVLAAKCSSIDEY